MTALHSPAPWKFRGSNLRDANGVLLYVEPDQSPALRGITIAQDDANRRLVESAPELLAIARRIAELADDAESIPYPLKVRFRIVCGDAASITEKLNPEP